MKPIDIVVPYVNCWDPEWMKLVSKHVGWIEYNRVRDLGTLRYFFRGVEVNLPWIHNVYLVVQSESQIPAWLNREHPKLKIVYHKDYIPKQFLPTFNSNVIELFYHKIKGLTNQFILANDDMAAIQPMQPENFFAEGKVVMPQVKYEPEWYLPYPRTLYDETVYNSAKIAGIITGNYNCPYYPNPHLLMPHLKSVYKFCWNRYSSGLKNTFKYWNTRNRRNVTHYLFNYVTAELGLTVYDIQYKGGFINVKDDATTPSLINALIKTESTMCCLNDDFKYMDIHSAMNIICNTLNWFLPKKCSFEL